MYRPPAGDDRGVPRPATRPRVLSGRGEILVVLGATAVGKSGVALAVAERIGGEIVGCDAYQVYRGFDVATAKPTPEDRRRVPHHVVDHVDPRRAYSVADYVHDADRAIGEIANRGRVAVVVGGTGMYLRGLLQGLVAAPPRDPALRERIRGWVERRGGARVHGLLARLDPVSARQVAPSDTQRLVRALEVVLATGDPLGSKIARDGTWGEGEARYRAVKVGLRVERDVHLARIAVRVDRFLEAGLVEEVRGLLAAGVPESANAFKAIGYRETLDALRRGHVDRGRLRERIVVRTRQFAKRQRTWFRSERNVEWIDVTRGSQAGIDGIARAWCDRAGCA